MERRAKSTQRYQKRAGNRSLFHRCCHCSYPIYAQLPWCLLGGEASNRSEAKWRAHNEHTFSLPCPQRSPLLRRKWYSRRRNKSHSSAIPNVAPWIRLAAYDITPQFPYAYRVTWESRKSNRFTRIEGLWCAFSTWTSTLLRVVRICLEIEISTYLQFFLI